MASVKKSRSSAAEPIKTIKSKSQALNIIIFNVIKDNEEENSTISTTTPAAAAAALPAVDESIAFIQRPPTAMETNYLNPKTKDPQSSYHAYPESTKKKEHYAYPASKEHTGYPARKEHTGYPARKEHSGYHYGYGAEEEDDEEEGFSVYATDSDPLEDVSIPSAFFTGLANQRPTSAVEVAAPAAVTTRTIPLIRPVAASSSRRNGMKLAAIPAIAGLATTFNLWWPAVSAFAGRRKRCAGRKRRNVLPEEDSGRAIDDKWLAILLGKKYANSTQKELRESIDNWKFRAENQSLPDAVTSRPYIRTSRNYIRTSTTTTPTTPIVEERKSAADESSVSSRDYNLVNDFLKSTLDSLDPDFDFSKNSNDYLTVKKTTDDPSKGLPPGGVTNSPITYVSLNPLYPPDYVNLIIGNPPPFESKVTTSLQVVQSNTEDPDPVKSAEWKESSLVSDTIKNQQLLEEILEGSLAGLVGGLPSKGSTGSGWSRPIVDLQSEPEFNVQGSLEPAGSTPSGGSLTGSKPMGSYVLSAGSTSSAPSGGSTSSGGLEPSGNYMTSGGSISSIPSSGSASFSGSKPSGSYMTSGGSSSTSGSNPTGSYMSSGGFTSSEGSKPSGNYMSSGGSIASSGSASSGESKPSGNYMSFGGSTPSTGSTSSGGLNPSGSYMLPVGSTSSEGSKPSGNYMSSGGSIASSGSASFSGLKPSGSYMSSGGSMPSSGSSSSGGSTLSSASKPSGSYMTSDGSPSSILSSGSASSSGSKPTGSYMFSGGPIVSSGSSSSGGSPSFSGSKPSGNYMTSGGSSSSSGSKPSGSSMSSTGSPPSSSGSSTSPSSGGSNPSTESSAGSAATTSPPEYHHPAEPEPGTTDLLDVGSMQHIAPSEPETGLPEFTTTASESVPPAEPETGLPEYAHQANGLPAEPEASLYGLIQQLNGNLTTGLIGLSYPSAGIHFVNSSNDVIDLNPYNEATPTSSIGIQPLSGVLITQPVVAESFTEQPLDGAPAESVVVDASATLVGAPSPNLPDVSPNANLFLVPGVATAVAGVPGVIADAVVEGAEATVTVSGGTTVGTVVTYSLVTLGLAVAAYAAVATFPLWLPFVLKKRRRSSYELPKRKYLAVRGSDGADVDRTQDVSRDELNLSSYLYGPPAYRHGNNRRRRR